MFGSVVQQCIYLFVDGMEGPKSRVRGRSWTQSSPGKSSKLSPLLSITLELFIMTTIDNEIENLSNVSLLKENSIDDSI